MRVTLMEDEIIQRWTRACGEKHECGRCPDRAACQALADRLIMSVGVRSSVSPGRPRKVLALQK